MEQAAASGRAKKVLALAVVLNVALLGFFKYADFFVENLNALTGLAIPALQIPLLIGISFYARFQAMSYLIDLYRGDCRCSAISSPSAPMLLCSAAHPPGRLSDAHGLPGELADRRENF